MAHHPVAMGDKAICIIHMALHSVLLAALVKMMGKMKILATVMQLHLQNPQNFNLRVAQVPTWESINGGRHALGLHVVPLNTHTPLSPCFPRLCLHHVMHLINSCRGLFVWITIGYPYKLP